MYPVWVARVMAQQGIRGRQCMSVLYTERLDDVGAAPSIGTVGDSYDNAVAESVMGLFKTELHRNPAALEANGGRWKGLDDLEPATCGWVSWFNEEPLHSEPRRHDADRVRSRLPSQVSARPRPVHRSW
jgi:hypothetical protein